MFSLSEGLNSFTANSQHSATTVVATHAKCLEDAVAKIEEPHYEHSVLFFLRVHFPKCISINYLFQLKENVLQPAQAVRRTEVCGSSSRLVC